MYVGFVKLSGFTECVISKEKVTVPKAELGAHTT